MKFSNTLVFLVILLISFGCRSDAGKSVSIGLHAKWRCTPLVLEAAEAISQTYGEFWFWSFVSQATDAPSHVSDLEEYKWTMAIVKDMLGDGAKTFVQHQLASRKLSPTVEVHATVADQAIELLASSDVSSDTFAVVGLGSTRSVIVTSVDDLDRAIVNSEDEKFDDSPADLAELVLRNEHELSKCRNYGNSSNDIPVVILYGHIGKTGFAEWHSHLTELNANCKVRYILRHHFTPCSEQVALDGFDVSVYLKRVDYVVVDDKNFTNQLFPYNDGLPPKSIRQGGPTGEGLSTLTDISPEALQCLTLNVVDAARKAGGLDGLLAMLEDFPSAAAAASGETDFPCDDTEVEKRKTGLFELEVLEGAEEFIVNNFALDWTNTPAVMECGAALALCKDALAGVGLSDSGKRLLRAFPEATSRSLRLDLSGVEPFFLTDIETDDSYVQYLSDWRLWAEGRLERFRFRANFITITITVVAAKFEHYGFMSLFQQVLSQGLPFRLGLVLLYEGDEDILSKKIIALTRYIQDVRDSRFDAFSFLGKVSYDGIVTDSGLIEAAEGVGVKLNGKSLNELVEEQAGYTNEVNKLKQSLDLNLDDYMLFINGLVADGNVMGYIDNEIDRIQESIRKHGAKRPSHDIVFSDANTVLRRNPAAANDKAPRIKLAPLFIDSQFKRALESVRYLQTATFPPSKVTLWLCGNADSDETIRLLEKYLEWFLESQEKGSAVLKSVRFGLLGVFESAEDLLKRMDMPNFDGDELTKLVDDLLTRREGSSDIRALLEGAVCESFTSSVFLLVNGRYVGHQDVKEALDYELIVYGELALTAEDAFATLSTVSGTTSDQILLGANCIGLLRKACGSFSKASVDVENKAVSDFVFRSKETEDEPWIQATAVASIANPLSPLWLRTLVTMSEMLHARVSFLAYPGAIYEDDVNTFAFSRRVVATEPSFDSHGIRSSWAERAVFHDLPQDKILTVSIGSPRNWLLESHAAAVDMDNIYLSLIPDEHQHLHAEYALDSIIVDGSCVDRHQQPPAGTKLELRHTAKGSVVDTLVMENLGYYQFKVSHPGLWHLSLAGKAASIFELDQYADGRGAIDLNGKDSLMVHVDNLKDVEGNMLKLSRKKGMEEASIVESREEQKAAREDTCSASRDSSCGADDDTINVFSVASGHLYERFLKIMILSVTKNASKPVKFWLLKNYLSPGFKSMLPLFAAERGFKYELVTYRWPDWLRDQKEKQRTLWGYKILFLDVLFPLTLKRVIFVDSDQVVRGDLKELHEMDINGAPYGYAPFCDSRKEIDGFRFWKSGFWKQHLGNKPYHISALYLVDLARFREIRAGDKLRQIYQQLSGDPHSLSNLDQDLPNYASSGPAGDRVPLHSLPKEWLWCETWCDDESKKKAKTIDLCNNPMTKEPKLDSAARIIAEWTSYDNEATNITERAYGEILQDGESKTSASDQRENEKSVVDESASDAEEVKEEL
ncbi:hypothetical protein NDN08_001253 [Rhodosorus marinus]|uniref:UDP-glucose:glycoprotein glucosyltransferase n=1 Tax=Rhodosorus marinus TaxID=101924 RepID=A0AAV8UUE0_9RHOD|nr:hypothetical protein NDN08_001253 [Rhodosorus marinus]